MNEEWKKGFHNKLNDYETTPPQGLFDKILKHIPPVEEGEKAPNKPIEVPITAANANHVQNNSLSMPTPIKRSRSRLLFGSLPFSLPLQ